MGLPEKFANTPIIQGDTPIVVVSSTTAPKTFPNSGRLGFQYVLGILPLTRIYLQHPLDELLTEQVIQILTESGYSVYVASQDELGNLTPAMPNIRILSIEKVSLTINAYDLLFVRRISIAGSFDITISDTLEDKLHTETVFIAEASYERYAHAPLLMSRFIAALVPALQSKIIPLVNSKRRRINMTPSNLTNLLLLPLPRVSVKTPEDLLQSLADSYGLPDLPALDTRQLSRLVQRGMDIGVSEVDIPGISITSTTSSITSGWILEADLAHLELNPSHLTVSIDYHLVAKSQHKQSLLLQKSCTTTMPVFRKVDGYYIVTLQHAVALNTVNFLTNSCAQPKH